MMGMGEPLHNFEPVLEARHNNRQPWPEHRTCSGRHRGGHIPGILRPARHPKRYSLAVSLHGAVMKNGAS